MTRLQPEGAVPVPRRLNPDRLGYHDIAYTPLGHRNPRGSIRLGFAACPGPLKASTLLDVYLQRIFTEMVYEARQS